MDFSTLIQYWYRLNHRRLPWRSTNDPYFIWLSEVILQQTRVDQGLPYYYRFTETFPNITTLANAPEDTVLKLWQGLGYYSRARNLHFAAKHIEKNFNGKLPSNYNELLTIKGIGTYTAAAIASFAFNLPHAVVDGNVNRVLSRVFHIDQPIDTVLGKRIMNDLAQQLLDIKNPAQHNQAIMELGALICTPKQPKCNVCPVNEKCLAHQHSNQNNYPIKSKKAKVRNRYFNYLVITNGKKVILNKRGKNDIWEGLYDFRLIEKQNNQPLKTTEISSLKPISSKKVFYQVHLLSHQKIHATFWLIHVKKINPLSTEIIVDLNELSDYPMPQLLIRYLNDADF